tara:strand:+ start:1478 stop:1870 length:393 start_codon:yes stop_codon:yes gene_type:complete
LINIERNTINTVVVTTTEEGTATYYLFEFKSDTTEEVVYCIAQDTSLFPDRFNKFAIQEVGSGTPVPINGEVKLENDGQWQYFIYANSSSSNLDPTGLTMLEQGIVKVTGTLVATSTYSGGNATYAVYGE